MGRLGVAPLVAALTCAGPSGEPQRPASTRDHEAAAGAPADAPTAGPPRDDELSWDDHVGWEPEHHFAPGEHSYHRPEGSTLVLEYSLGPYFETIAARSAGVPLHDKPLIVRHPEELCHAALREAVAHLAPRRLLIHVDVDLDDRALACLAQLEVADIFLSTCRHDGANPVMDHCSDGDAQLARLAATAALRTRLRGLAIGVGDRSAWDRLLQFPRLTHVVVRGDALEIGAASLCELSELRHVDVLDAYHPGAAAPMLPAECILRWTSFAAWRLESLERYFDAGGDAGSVPCRLRSLFTDRLDEAHRPALLAACPELRALEVMHPLEHCERADADHALRCRPI